VKIPLCSGFFATNAAIFRWEIVIFRTRRRRTRDKIAWRVATSLAAHYSRSTSSVCSIEEILGGVKTVSARHHCGTITVEITCSSVLETGSRASQTSNWMVTAPPIKLIVTTGSAKVILPIDGVLAPALNIVYLA
jgi:hypothetical protein